VIIGALMVKCFRLLTVDHKPFPLSWVHAPILTSNATVSRNLPIAEVSSASSFELFRFFYHIRYNIAKALPKMTINTNKPYPSDSRRKCTYIVITGGIYFMFVET
jgi:hypothetical protein